jgi:hypothetical protein
MGRFMLGGGCRTMREFAHDAVRWPVGVVSAYLGVSIRVSRKWPDAALVSVIERRCLKPSSRFTGDRTVLQRVSMLPEPLIMLTTISMGFVRLAAIGDRA